MNDIDRKCWALEILSGLMQCARAEILIAESLGNIDALEKAQDRMKAYELEIKNNLPF